ncbi:MAG: GTP-binding protein [Aequorivita sp.]|nr:GTP-binding protein [Aequorivita sp.]
MLSNEIVLRPRFQMELEQPCSQLLTKFSKAKKDQNIFIISCVDDHVFIKLPKNQQHFWSPQLHLELSEISENKCSLHGFFGPNPTVWTMFMFLHVAVGILFMVNLTWLYSNYNLGNSIGLQIGISIILVLTWVLLYVAGRIGKKKGKSGMRELYDFMQETIES